MPFQASQVEVQFLVKCTNSSKIQIEVYIEKVNQYFDLNSSFD